MKIMIEKLCFSGIVFDILLCILNETTHFVPSFHSNLCNSLLLCVHPYSIKMGKIPYTFHTTLCVVDMYVSWCDKVVQMQ